MNQKSKMNLLISTICTCLVVCSLYFMYDIFAFHTYGDVRTFDDILSLNDDKYQLDGVEIYKDRNNIKISEGTLTIDSSSFQQSTYQIVLSLVDHQNKASYRIVQDFDYQNNQDKIQLSEQTLEFELNDLTKASIQIKSNQDIIYQHDLTITPVKPLYSANKEYRLASSTVAPYYMKLGYLTTTNQNIIKQYPYVSLEYRYLKTHKKNKNNDNNYVVFKKVSGLSKNLVNHKNNDIYRQDSKDARLDHKDLSVVVIFSKDNGKSFVFKMDLSLEAGE